MTMRVEIVRTPGRMAEVGPAWDALWKRGDQSIFQSHGWIDAWWSSKRASNLSRLCVGLCWVEDKLVVVMPFTTHWHRGVRVLEWAAKDCSDYCDAIVDPELADGWRYLENVWAAVTNSGHFDVAYLSHVRPDAVVSKMLDGWQKSVKLKHGQRSARSLQVRNDAADGHSWFRSLNKKARNNHTRGMRIVGETGPVAIRVSEPGEGIEAVLERMIELKQQWLVNTGQSTNILNDDALILRALVKELGRKQMLRLFSIHCGDTVVAGSLNIVTGTHMQAFFSAYDPQFDRASPGTLVMVEYLMWAFNKGMTEVDFLCGEEEYKFKFANAQVDLVSFVGARTLIGKLALAFSERLDRARKPEARTEPPQLARALEA